MCDNACNNAECGHDGGDCVCAPDCHDGLVNDGVCDSACNNAECGYDGGDCYDENYYMDYVARGEEYCEESDFDKKDCKSQPICSWHDGECWFSGSDEHHPYEDQYPHYPGYPQDDHECAPGCPDRWITDGMCDSACNNAECGYDGGHCSECAPGCYDSGITDGM